MVSDERFLAGPAVMEDIFAPEPHIYLLDPFVCFLVFRLTMISMRWCLSWQNAMFSCLQVLHLETLKDDIAGLEERLCTRQGQSGFPSFPTWKDDRYCCWKKSLTRGGGHDLNRKKVLPTKNRVVDPIFQ